MHQIGLLCLLIKDCLNQVHMMRMKYFVIIGFICMSGALLALPIVPAHHPEECQQPAGADEPDSSKDEVSRSNPFSVLAQLKRDPNV